MTKRGICFPVHEDQGNLIFTLQRPSRLEKSWFASVRIMSRVLEFLECCLARVSFGSRLGKGTERLGAMPGWVYVSPTPVKAAPVTGGFGASWYALRILGVAISEEGEGG